VTILHVVHDTARFVCLLESWHPPPKSALWVAVGVLFKFDGAYADQRMRVYASQLRRLCINLIGAMQLDNAGLP